MQAFVVQAFTRCAHQEPDNGEAWNNIAAIHLQLQHPPQAFSALSEAVKFNRDSWQTWSNYGHAAAQTSNGVPAARAVQKASTLPFDCPVRALRFVLVKAWWWVRRKACTCLDLAHCCPLSLLCFCLLRPAGHEPSTCVKSGHVDAFL